MISSAYLSKLALQAGKGSKNRAWLRLKSEKAEFLKNLQQVIYDTLKKDEL